MATRRNRPKTPAYLSYLDTVAPLGEQGETAESPDAFRITGRASPVATPVTEEAVEAPASAAAPIPTTPEAGGGLLDYLRNSVSMGGTARAAAYAADAAKASWAGRQKNDAVAELYGETQDIPLVDAQNEGSGIPGFGLQKTSRTPPNRENLQAAILKASEDAAAANERLKAVEESVAGGRNNPALIAARAAGSVASQPEMLLPLAGGAVGSLAGPGGTVAGAAVGSVPMADLARRGAIAEAVELYQQEGIEIDAEARADIDAYANVMMGTEFALDVLGGASGGLVTAGAKRLGLSAVTKKAAQDAIVGRIRSRTARVAIGAAAEGVTEGGTELLQEGVRNLGDDDFFANEAVTGAFKNENAKMAVNRLDRVLDATAAGIVGGGAIGGIAGNLAYAAEEGARQQGVAKAVMENLEGEKANIPAPAPAPAPVVEEAAPAPAETVATEPEIDPAQKEAEIEAAYLERQRELNREAQRSSIIRRVDTARQEVEGLQERIDNGDISQGTLNNMTAALREQRTAENTLAQWDENSAARNPDKEVALEVRPEPEPVAAPPAPEPVVDPQVQARRKAVADRQRKVDAGKKAEVTRQRNIIMDQVIAENPDATDAAIRSMVDERVAQSAVPVPTTNDAPVSPAQREPSDVVGATPDPVRQSTPTIPDGDLDDAGVSTLADALGVSLNQEAKTPAARKAAAAPNFRTAADAIARTLVSKNSQGTTDVQNLILQGKLIVAPNPESVGRQSQGEAEYDIGTSKMYLYTDRVDPNNVVEVMAAALHESTHAGQFNEREGRSSVFETLMGDEYMDANDRIRRAATEGNRVAQEAVRMATEAGANVENLEVVPYFATLTARDRTGLGRLRGLANDIEASARGFMRDRLGVDLDINVAELAAATQRVAGEIAQTEITPDPENNAALDMIAGRGSPRFPQAQREGRTYTDRDGMEKFITSDADSRLLLTEEVGAKILAGNATVADVVDNPTIREDYPELLTTPIRVEPSMGYGGAMASDGNGGYELLIGNSILADAMPQPEAELGWTSTGAGRMGKGELHSLILHELQHGIQGIEGFAKGGNPGQFRTRADNRLINEHRQNTVAHNMLMDMMRNDLNDLVDNPEVRADIQEVYAEYAAMDIDAAELSNGIARAIRMGGTPSRELLDFRNQAIQTLRDYRNTTDRMAEMQERTYQQYRNLLGEQESRFVEANRGVPEDELPTRPSYPDESIVTMEVGGVPQSLDQLPRFMKDRDGNTRSISPMVQSLFDSAVGTGPVAREIMEFAVSSPAMGRMEAEQSMARFDNNIKELATERGVDVKELVAELTEQLDALDTQTNGVQANRAAFNAVASQYGKAGQDLMDMRSQVDNLTTDILKQRASIAREFPLTPAEKETYKTLLNNMGRYAHRTYAVNAGKPGKRYANKVWDSYKKGDNTHNAQVASNAIDYIVDRNLYIPDATEIGDSKQETLSNLVGVWGLGRPEAMTRPEMEQVLLTARDAINGDSDRMKTMAEDITKELLGLKEALSPITSYYRGGKRNDGILRERQGVPPQIRELMGEITHPAGRLMVTAAKQAEFVARNRAQLELRAAVDNDPRTAEHLQPPSAAGTPAVRNMTKLTGDAWGALEGYYASPNMNGYLSDVTQQLATFEQSVFMAAANPGILTETGVRAALGKWGTLAGWSKASQIIANPVNYGFNFVGAPRMLLNNGNLNPATWWRAVKSSAELISSAHNPRSAGDEAKRLNTYGVTDSAFIGELKSVQFRRMESIIREMSGDNPYTVMSKLKGAASTASEFYAMMDVWSKIANFYHQADNVLPAYYEAAGQTRTREQLDREAADIVNATNITYKRAAPMIKAIERGGITQFGTYFYETFRSELANLNQGLNELQRSIDAPTPEAANIMRMQAAKRIGGQITAWSLTAAAAQALGAAVFGEDDEEAKALRTLMPEYLKNQDFMPIGKNDKGEVIMLDFSRLDPIGPNTDIMRLMMNGEATPENIRKQVFDLYVAPRIGMQMFDAGMALANRDYNPTRKPTFQQVAPSLYSNAILQPAYAIGLEDNQTRGLVNVAEAFMPGMITSWRNTNARVAPGTSTIEGDDTLSVIGRTSQEAMSTISVPLQYMGLTMYKMDPKRAVTNIGFKYGDTMTALRRDVKDMFTENPDTLSEDQIIARLTSLRSREQQVNNELRTVYRGLQGVGIAPRVARTMLKDSGLPQEAIQIITDNNSQSRVVDRSSITRYKQNELKGVTDAAEKKEIRDKWDGIWNTLEGADRELRRRQQEDSE